jgi:hypothetical protein
MHAQGVRLSRVAAPFALVLAQIGPAERAAVAQDGGSVAGDIGPDVIVSLLHPGSNFTSYGHEGNISGFSVGTTSCNIGDANLDWVPSPTSNQHPVIRLGMYKLRENRFTQIGTSWVKHGFYALNQEVECSASCTNLEGGQTLFIGCSDPYVAFLNADRSDLGPSWEINAHTGSFPANRTLAVSTTRPTPNRLQVRNDDLDLSANAGSVYFVSGQYVHPDEAAASVKNNNASYAGALITFDALSNKFVLNVQSPTVQQQSAVTAWKDTDPTVMETEAQVPDEGLFILAAKAIDLGTGFWRYEYALQNLNSDRSAGLFAVPLPESVVVDDQKPPGFHDVGYHDGDGVACNGCTCSGGSTPGAPCDVHADCTGGGLCRGGTRLNFDGTDWPATEEPGVIRWETTPYPQDPNANALRWGTLYNFWFDVNIGPGKPGDTTVIVGLFKPGFPSEIAISTLGPALTIIDCNDNGIADTCDLRCGPGCPPPCGGSLDCGPNGVPDECEIMPVCLNAPNICRDCQPNDIPDFCDIRDGESEDCQPNGVPDECEPDCDGDEVPDDCELILDTDADCVLDCDDSCPATTPAGRCCAPLDQMVQCCFSNHIMYDFWTWRECESFCLDDPDPENCGPVCDDPPVCPGTPCRESPCRDGCLIGDFDGDGDIDLADAAYLGTCFSGPTGIPAFVAPSAECQVHFDTEPDGDVDLTDYVNFFADYSGP